MNAKLATSVLFLIYNRPDTTAKVFEEIRKARPPKLFVRADGPRDHIEGEEERCRATREIVERVDWQCEVQTNFSDRNLGCKIAVSSGVDWFFDNVTEGIILEDDCVPTQSFFWFCQELLERYRDDERVMQISGSNYLFGKKVGESSYYFSKLNDVWGWATWRRAWQHFDINMGNFLEFKDCNDVENCYANKEIAAWMMKYFQAAFDGADDIWSTQWTYAMCVQNGLTVVPNVNLVSNIGFTKNASHSSGDNWAPYRAAKTGELSEIVHAPFVSDSKAADELRFETIRRTDPRAHRRRFPFVRTAVGAVVRRLRHPTRSKAWTESGQ